MGELRIVGKSVKKVDAYSKVTGKAIYAEDIQLPGMLHAKVLRSQYPHAYLQEIDISKAKTIPGVRCVLTAKDIKGTNRYGLVVDDQQVLAETKVRFVGDAIAAVAAETEEQAKEAVKNIKVIYRKLPAISTVEEALADGAQLIYEKDVPIFMESPSFVTPFYNSVCRNITQATGIWSELKQRLLGIQGV